MNQQQNQQPQIADGHYTVVVNAKLDTYITFRFKTFKDRQYISVKCRFEDSAWTKFAVTTVTKLYGLVPYVYAAGLDETDWVSALYSLFAKFDKDPISLHQAGMTYALKSGHCYRCGRKLTVPASIYNGLGPDCAGKTVKQHRQTAQARLAV